MSRPIASPAAVLIALGREAFRAIREVRAVRPGAVETQRQEQFLKSYAAWRALRKDTP